MKGRTVRAMRRGMAAWHADLALGRLADGRTFEPSGLRPMDIDRSRWNAAGQRVTEVWHCREVLDGNTLVDEGRAMGHCVYSYADRIVSRECAIWTLTLEDDTGHWRRLTIEVRPSTKEIVQARGRFNRTPEAADLRALEAWAARNALEISLGRF